MKKAFEKYYSTPVTKTQLRRVKLPCEEQVFQAERAGFYGGYEAATKALMSVKFIYKPPAQRVKAKKVKR